ncbi:MAG: hypothetical protein K6A44_05285 [bacterium]|nr:hypothetical protein [bacterium]
MKLLSFFSKLLDYIYYRKCYLCSKKCTDISICPDCTDKIFSDISYCKTKKFGVEIFSGAIYETEILKIIRALKYHKKQEFEKILSDVILKTIENYELNFENFIICPVPIHQNRMKKRKYNHMELVADSIGKKLDIKVQKDLIKRVKDTAPLYKLSIPERKKAIDGAFEVSDEVKDKNILLIDDIITSGTTVKEISRLINEKGASSLVIISATRSKSFI